jgi:hypothetical protein
MYFNLIGIHGDFTLHTGDSNLEYTLGKGFLGDVTGYAVLKQTSRILMTESGIERSGLYEAVPFFGESEFRLQISVRTRDEILEVAVGVLFDDKTVYDEF